MLLSGAAIVGETLRDKFRLGGERDMLMQGGNWGGVMGGKGKGAEGVLYEDGPSR